MMDEVTVKSSVTEENFEEIEEPSLESSDPNERKFARQLRIQRRAEALQKLETDDGTKVIEQSLTEKQVHASAEVLEKLIKEGYEVITNVRIANDAREIERRKEVAKLYEHFTKRLEESNVDCKKLYNVINKQWPSIMKLKDPLDINDAMESQTERCNRLLAQKDGIIAELREELEKSDKMYFENQKKQKDDIKLLIERIDNQMNIVENAYSRELQLIEKTLETERESLVKTFQKQWDVLFEQEEEEDRIGDEKLNEIMKEYEEEMEKLKTDHDEAFRAKKILLDKECQQLQREVENTKALCLLNTEKLSYKYTVLKNREEKNTILKSLQKRKINKLQGIINTLKQNYTDLETSTKSEIDKLSKQILKAHKNIIALEEKSDHFTRINEKQYLDVWNMNTEKANQLVEQILAADRIIHERTLGVLWEPPVKTLPKKEDMPSYCKAISIIKKRKQEEAEACKMLEYEQLEESSSEAKLQKIVLNNILRQISSCSKYLIEDKLQEFILNRSEEEKTIIQLDNVFQALSISTPEEINMLLNFFLPYSYCVICSEKEESIISESIKSSSGTVCDCHIDEKGKKLIRSVKEEIGVVSQNKDDADTTKSVSASHLSSESLINEDSVSINKEKIETKASKFTCDKGHILEIQTVHVTKAMKDIVAKYREIEQRNKISFEQRIKEKKYTISRNLSEEDVKNYWSRYREIFGKQKEQLWDAILIGVNKYHEVLQERHKLCTEIENIRKQNAELQRLLQYHKTGPEDGLSWLQAKSAKNSAHKLKMKT